MPRTLDFFCNEGGGEFMEILSTGWKAKVKGSHPRYWMIARANPDTCSSAATEIYRVFASAPQRMARIWRNESACSKRWRSFACLWILCEYPLFLPARLEMEMYWHLHPCLKGGTSCNLTVLQAFLSRIPWNLSSTGWQEISWAAVGRSQIGSGSMYWPQAAIERSKAKKATQ